MTTGALPQHLRLIAVDELPEGRTRVVALSQLGELPADLEHLYELRLAVARVGTIAYAVEDRCSHDGGALGDSPVLDEAGKRPQVVCTRHGARFDLATGKATRMPAIRPIRAYPATIVDGFVTVDLSGA